MQSCPDGHHCLHGSKCVKNAYKEGSFYCDCDEVVFEARYEGLRCEHRAEIYCTDEGKNLQEQWFCTNGGTCSTHLSNQDNLMWGCECPDDYEGQFCQFVKGTKPVGYPFNAGPGDTTQGYNSAGVVVGSLVVVMVMLVVTGAIFYRRRDALLLALSGRDSLDLDPDGKSMKSAISASMQEANTIGMLPLKKFRGGGSANSAAATGRDLELDPDGSTTLQDITAILVEGGNSKKISSPTKSILRGPKRAEPQSTQNAELERPSTTQSAGGISYASSQSDGDDNSMLSIT